MKTITTTTDVYSFAELSEDAKQKAINNYRNNDNYDGNFGEIEDSVKKVIELFNLKTGRSYTDIRTGHIEDTILELKGVRLYKYLVNNYWNDLFKGKYYSLWSKAEKSYKYYKEGYPVLKSRRSKIIFNNECVLTGVCYDNDILEPIYSFLQRPDKNTTFEDLMNDIENAIAKTYRTEEEWINSDEYIIEAIEANEYQFTEDGEQF